MALVKSLQMFPTAVLRGKNFQAYLTSVLIALSNAILDVGGRIKFLGFDSRGEVLTRSILRDRSYVVMRGELVGENK